MKYKKIPNSIKDHLSNANCYLESAKKFPYPTCDAVRMLLLLTAWENMKIAEEELSAWVRQTTPSKKLYRSHAYKFQKAPQIDRIILGPRGTSPETIIYASDSDFEELISICRYGPKTGSKDLTSIFKRGWNLDTFQNSLIDRINWENTTVKMYEDLMNRKMK